MFVCVEVVVVVIVVVVVVVVVVVKINCLLTHLAINRKKLFTHYLSYNDNNNRHNS